MEELAGCLFSSVFELLFKLAMWLLLLPLFLIAATPVILVLSLGSLPTYFAEVRNRYGKVVAYWLGLARHA